MMQFNRYLQDVARICADDYNFISQGALQYSEVLILQGPVLSSACTMCSYLTTEPKFVFQDILNGCLEYIKTFPQFYQIHEMTSLTGGTFNPALTLTFEKQLLIMVMYL